MTQDQQSELTEILYATHFQAAQRDNASTQILKAVYEVTNGNYLQAVTAAIQTFGGKHAPIKDAIRLLEDIRFPNCHEDRLLYLKVNWKYGKIPGFGSSFVKKNYDKKLDSLADLIFHLDPFFEVAKNEIKDYLLLYREKDIYPNLAFYTAAACIILKININLCETLMLESRIRAWSDILTEIEDGKKRPTQAS